MKLKKVRVKFDSLERGNCFRFTSNGPIYMKDAAVCNVAITGTKLGRVIFCSDARYVYPAKVKIVEEK